MSPCIYCKSDEHKLLYTTYDLWQNNYHIAQCYNCSAYFLTPYPSDDIMDLAYDESYYGCSEKKFKGPVEKVLDYFRRQRAKKLSRLLKKDDNVLDIGCGNGNFLMSLLNYGKFNLYGSELDGKSAQRAAAHKEIALKTGPLNTSDYAPESFSLISLIHVFEHLNAPEQMLNNIDYLLKKDGHLFMSFPNIDSFQSRFFKGKWLHLDPPRHLFFFSPKIFKNIMMKRGYEVVSETHFSIEQNPFGMVQSLLNTIFKKRELLFEHLKGHTAYTADYSGTNLFMQKLFFAGMMPFAIILDGMASIFKKGATVEFILKKK